MMDMELDPPASASAPCVDQESCTRGGRGRGRRRGRRRARSHGTAEETLTGEREHVQENNDSGHFRGRGRGGGNSIESRVEEEHEQETIKISRGHYRGGGRWCGRGRSRGRGRGGYNVGPGTDQIGCRGGRRRQGRGRRGLPENTEEVETVTEVEEETCICCDASLPKYKCPTCYLKYCSVACCKSHKSSGTCSKPADSALTPATDVMIRATPGFPGRTPYLFPTENTVPLKKLAQLSTGANLDRLKHLLSSSRVRDLILRLDIAEEKNADSEFMAVMECPEFAEFAAFATQVLNSDEEDSQSDED